MWAVFLVLTFDAGFFIPGDKEHITDIFFRRENVFPTHAALSPMTDGRNF